MLQHILAVIFVIVLFLMVYFFVVRHDIKEAKRYRKAKKCKGMVFECLGEKKIGFYGDRTQRIYYKYMIRFSTNEGLYEDVLITDDANLTVGNTVEIHYDKDEGEPHIVNDISYKKMRELTIASIVATFLLLLLGYLRLKGSIEQADGWTRVLRRLFR